MTVLVTGGAGFIGNPLMRALLARGERVVNVDALTPAASLSSIWDLEEDPRYALETVDVCDRPALASLFRQFRPRAIVHLAIERGAGSPQDRPLGTVQTNVLGHATVLDAAQAYWDGIGRPDRFRVLTVRDAPRCGAASGSASARFGHAFSPLSVSLAAAADLAGAWHTNLGLPSVQIEADALYGPGQGMDAFVPRVIAQALGGRSISLEAGGTVRTWLHVEDFVTAILVALAEGDPGAVYGPISGQGDGAAIHDADIAKTICRQLQVRRPAPHAYADRIEPRSPSQYAPMDAVGEAGPKALPLPWSPALSLEAGLAQTVDWYLTRQMPTSPKRDEVGPADLRVPSISSSQVA